MRRYHLAAVNAEYMSRVRFRDKAALIAAR